CADAAAFVEIPRRAAADLAARGLRHRLRRSEHDLVGGSAENIGSDLLRARLQQTARRRVALRGLHQDHGALGARGRIYHTEGGDAVRHHAGNRADRLLDLLRQDVPAGTADDVLDTAGDVHLAARDIGLVAAVEPSVVEQLARLGLVAEIAGGGRGPAEFETPLAPLAQFAAELVDDAHLVRRQRLPAGDDLEGVRVLRLGRLGRAAAAQGLAR